MRIRLSQLRSIIVEEVRRQLLEAPLEDVLPATNPNVTRRFPPPDDPSRVRDPKAVSKFFGSPSFRLKAEATFRLWNIPVIIQPVSVAEKSAFSLSPDMQRSRLLSGDAAKEILSTAGVDDDRRASLVEAMGRGAVVILALNSFLLKGFLPTPWMLIHALWDNFGTDGSEGFPADFNKVRYGLYDRIKKFDSRRVIAAMTMGSARGGQLNGNFADIVSELLTQATVTTKGVVFKATGDADLDAGLEGIADWLNSLDLRGLVERTLKGHVLVLAAENAED